MAAPPPAPRPPLRPAPPRIARSLIPAPVPRPPAPPPPPPAATHEPDGKGRGALWVALLALAVVAAFAIGLLAGKSTDQAFGFDRSRFDYGPYGPGTGPIVIVDERDYYSYLNLSVRPTLVTVSVSFTGAACDAIGKDDPGAVGRLKEAKDAALEAVEQNLRVTPPPQFQHLHETVGKVFAHTATTADKLVGCIESGDADCKAAQGDLVQLLDDTGRLTGDVKQLVKGL